MTDCILDISTADYQGKRPGTIGDRPYTVVLTDAQIKTLPTIPFPVVQPLGPGTILVPLWTIWVADFTAGAYTNVAPDAWLAVRYASNADAFGFVVNDAAITNTDVGPTQLSDFLSALHQTVRCQPYCVTEDVDEWGPVPQVQLVTDVNNSGFVLNLDNQGAGNLTGGNAANTLTVTTFYASLTL